MRAPTLPKPRVLPHDLAHAVALFIGPVPRYAPNERAPSVGQLGPIYRQPDGFGRLDNLNQLARLRP